MQKLVKIDSICIRFNIDEIRINKYCYKKKTGKMNILIKNLKKN